jgi:hypothetical protein
MIPRDILIVNGTVVTGDGSTVHEMGSILIRNGRIADVTAGRIGGPLEAEIIDASGCVVVPGIINAHAHGCTCGPAMLSGSLPFLLDDVEYYRNRHLMAGTTTLLNVCGLALHHEIETEFPGDGHPLDVFISTAHTPCNIAAAEAVDGKGLTDQHRMVTLEDMILAGARVLGEAGGGQTLGGGAQEYRFIPDAISAKTGKRIHPNVARRLKEAIVGRRLDLREPDVETVGALIDEGGLGRLITVSQMTELVTGTVMPPVALSLKGFVEIADACERFSLAGIFHNAAPTAALICELATSHPKARIIAAHSNHPSFGPEECLQVATNLKERGAVIDVSTLDCISTRWRNGPENLDALMSAGLVDTISTDFAGGDWDGILEALHRSVLLGQCSLAQAIALGTGNVARVLPEIAGDRGLLERGRRADVVISARNNLSRVRHALKNGRAVISNGL